MRMKLRKIRFETIALMLLYIAYVFVLFWFHPFVASAAETDTANKNVPGGKGNAIRVYEKSVNVRSNVVQVRDRTIKANNDVEIAGYLRTDEYGNQYLCFGVCRDGEDMSGSVSNFLSDFVGVIMNYDKNGVLTSSSNMSINDALLQATYYTYPDNLISVTCMITGLKIFKDRESYLAYVDNGSLDGLIKEELDTSWYLKNLGYKVTADDSPSGSGGEDATYITFTWLTDNLQDGDLLEIKTYNHYKKIGGDKISGFHDYITFHDNVSCLGNISIDSSGNERASYTFGQYEATKAWFATLENKPLIFKSYDTDIYYLRPYRDGKVGKWCKVTMGRNPATNGSPYIEKIEIGDIDDDGEFVRDDDLTEENGGDDGRDQNGNPITHDPENPFEGTNIVGVFNYLFDFFKSLPSLLGDLPALVNSIIGFLPSAVTAFIAAGILIVIVLRIVGR